MLEFIEHLLEFTGCYGGIGGGMELSSALIGEVAQGGVLGEWAGGREKSARAEGGDDGEGGADTEVVDVTFILDGFLGKVDGGGE